MVIKHTKKDTQYHQSLRKCKSKSTVRYHFTPTKMVIIIKKKDQG